MCLLAFRNKLELEISVFLFKTAAVEVSCFHFLKSHKACLLEVLYQGCLHAGLQCLALYSHFTSLYYVHVDAFPSAQKSLNWTSDSNASCEIVNLTAAPAP